MNELEYYIQFGCGPGRPLSQKSLARIQKLGKGTWCDRKTKDGRIVHYKTDKGKRLESEGKKKRAELRAKNKRYKEKIAKRKAEGKWIGRTRKVKAEQEKKQVEKLKPKKVKAKKVKVKKTKEIRIEKQFEKLRNDMQKWREEYKKQKDKTKAKKSVLSFKSKKDRAMVKRLRPIWMWVSGAEEGEEVFFEEDAKEEDFKMIVAKGESYEEIKEYDRKGMKDEKTLQDFERVFNEMPIYKGKIFRHISPYKGEKKAIRRLRKLKPGDEYIFDSYSSFRPQDTPGIGMLYLEKKEIVLYMKNKKGRDITPILGNEMGEVILPKGRYRVKKNEIKKLGEINSEFPEKYGKEQEVQAIELEEI